MVLMCVLVFNSAIAIAQEQSVDTEQPKVSFEVASEFLDLIDSSTRQVLATAQVNDNGDAWQLFRRLRPVIRDDLGTQGYFSPSIQRVVDSQIPEDQAPELKIKIEQGTQSKVVLVDI